MALTIASIIVFTVGIVCQLIVPYMERRQLRQIEMHREDPSVPLVPPPNAAVVFLKRYWVLGLWIASFAMCAILAALEFRRTTPMTRKDVFVIAISVAGVLFSTIMALLDSLSHVVFETPKWLLHELASNVEWRSNVGRFLVQIQGDVRALQTTKKKK